MAKGGRIPYIRAITRRYKDSTTILFYTNSQFLSGIFKQDYEKIKNAYGRAVKKIESNGRGAHCILVDWKKVSKK